MNGNKYVIECDSQQFHENTEKERRYEKERDRYMTKEDYKILRYTGKEIMENPYKVAKNAISIMIDVKEKDLSF